MNKKIGIVVLVLIIFGSFLFLKYKNDLITWNWKTYSNTQSDFWKTYEKSLKVKSEFWIKYPSNLVSISDGGAGNASGEIQHKVLFTSQSEIDKINQIKAEDEKRCEGATFCTSTPFTSKGIYLTFFYDYAFDYIKSEFVPVQGIESGKRMYQSHGSVSQATPSECAGSHGTYIDDSPLTMFMEKLDEGYYLQICASKDFQDIAKKMLSTFNWRK